MSAPTASETPALPGRFGLWSHAKLYLLVACTVTMVCPASADEIKISSGSVSQSASFASAPPAPAVSLTNTWYRAVRLRSPDFNWFVDPSPRLNNRGQVITNEYIFGSLSGLIRICLWENGQFKASATNEVTTLYVHDFNDDGLLLGFEMPRTGNKGVGFSLMRFAEGGLVRTPVPGYWEYEDLYDAVWESSGYITGQRRWTKAIPRIDNRGRLLTIQTLQPSLISTLSWLDPQTGLRQDIFTRQAQNWAREYWPRVGISYDCGQWYGSMLFNLQGDAVAANYPYDPFGYHDGWRVLHFNVAGARQLPVLDLAGASAFATGINDHAQIVGGIMYGSDIQYGRSGFCKAVVWDQGSVMELESEAYSMPLAVNKYGQIVGTSSPDAWGGLDAATFRAVLWDDRKRIDLNSRLVAPLLGGGILTGASQINDRGEILAWANLDYVDLYHLFPVRPELAVDANRDGVIKLASEDASDATSATTPYRFWINEGVDGPGSDGELTAEPGSFGPAHDYQKERIGCKRDLEDWTRLKLSIPKTAATGSPILALNDPQSGLEARLEWNIATLGQSGSSIPSLKFVAAVDDTKNYLKDPASAGLQIAGEQGKIIGQVDAAGSQCTIAAGLWKPAANGALEANLLFEGAAPGQGQLVMAVYRDGRRLSEVGPINLQIRSMQDLYEHWTANADDTAAHGAAISAAPVHPLGSHPAPFEFTTADPGLSLPAEPEGNEYILFVHGWRMQPYERRVFAETAAKRLYQLGYRGKFGLFSWPTEWVDLDVWYSAIVNALADPDHYDRSEVVARTSGHGPLARLLLDLRQRYGAGHVHIFAHSMGNVAVSEALLALPPDSPVAAHYVACQSAEVASAYENLVRDQNGDPSPEAPSASPSLGGPDRFTYSAPVVRDSAAAGLTDGDNYHKGLASRLSVMANFFNRADSALSKWDINQKLKPDHTLWLRDTSYSYDLVEEAGTNPAKVRDRYQEDPTGLTGSNQRHEIYWDSVAERHRILAFIVQARSRATGATAGIASEFNPGWQTDLNSEFSFNDLHSAEFLGDATLSTAFYRRLLKAFEISEYEEQ